MLIRFFLILAVCLINPINDSETIQWSASKKLEWTDFKGPKETESHVAAITASGITFSYSVITTGNRISSFEATAQALFYPKNSWFIKERCNDYILEHEQLHFDITELYTRIFRYRLAQLEVTQNIKTQLNNLHKTINQELSETQHQYDIQSDNSINKTEQVKWNTYVAENLKKYEAYKSK